MPEKKKRRTRAEVRVDNFAKVFKPGAEAMLTELGAEKIVFLYGETWFLPTCYGTLSVHVYEDWLACRFLDYYRARPFFNDVVGSGKWNHHAFIGQGFAPWPTPENFLARCRRELSRVLTRQTEADNG